MALGEVENNTMQYNLRELENEILKISNTPVRADGRSSVPAQDKAFKIVTSNRRGICFR